MTDPQPYTEAQVRSHITDLDATVPGSRLAATLRDYQRVLAENEALRVAVESGEQELQAVFLALNPECPAHPGQPNTCDNGVCDCFGDVNMGQQVAALRADKERLVEAGRFKRNAILHDCRCVTGTWVAVPKEDFAAFCAAIDAARSGGEEKHD